MFAYKRTKCRTILLHYDGIMMPMTSINKIFEHDLIYVLNSLCNDLETLFLLLVGGEGTLSASGSLHAKCRVLHESMVIL